MKKIIILIIVLFVSSIFIIYKFNKIQTMDVTIISIENNKLVVRDNGNNIYTFNFKIPNIKIGSNLTIKYEKNKIINYKINSQPNNKDELFSLFYTIAESTLKTLSLEEKIGQLFLVRYNEKDDIELLQKYKFGGYVFYKKDFENKTTNEVQQMIKNLQNNSKIPLLTAVDEEGGKVVRISSNPNLYPLPFKSPNELYNLGSFNLIRQDTIEKSKLLNNLGINLNLAPVIDVSTNPNDYMYERALGYGVELTKEYAKIVIEASKNTNVSYTLKHFPGYGNNIDTHIGSAIDTRSYEDILNNDIPPFIEGINAGAEAILVSHNIVSTIDNKPASLSHKINDLLRNKLSFSGVIITDDLDMGATNSIEDAEIQAILAGNDLLIISDYESIDSVKKAVENEIINEAIIDKAVTRILAWKHYKGLMVHNVK